MKLTCLECHIPLEFQRQSKKFCSNACTLRFRRRELRRPSGAPLTPVLHCGQFEGYAERYAGQIDVVITDPPYGKKYFPIYEALTRFVVTTLRPGGWIFCLTGSVLHYDVHTLFRAADFEEILPISYLMPGGTARFEMWTSTGRRMINQQTKPMLWYQKRGAKRDHRRAGSTDLIGNKITGKNTQKREVFHWQQDLEAFKQIANIYTNRDDIICDPMMGSGTTLAAALIEGRHRLIGIEQNRETYAQAVERIQQVQATAAGAVS